MPVLGGGRDLRLHVGGQRRVLLDPRVEPVQQPEQQHGADQRRAEGRAEVLRRPLQPAGLVRLAPAAPRT